MPITVDCFMGSEIVFLDVFITRAGIQRQYNDRRYCFVHKGTAWNTYSRHVTFSKAPYKGKFPILSLRVLNPCSRVSLAV